MKNTRIRIATAFAVALGIGCAQAQGYPAKPVRLVVGFPLGGGTDVVARIILPRFSEYLGQPVVIENRPGATGTVAPGMLAKSPPDGYMLMMGHISVNAIAPSLFENLQYDVPKDFAPLILTASVPHFVVVHPTLQVGSLKELVALFKAAPGKCTFPSAGNGSTPHLAGEMFKSLAGVDLVHVPYQGLRPIDAGPARRRAQARVRHHAGLGALRALRPPEEFAALVRADTARYAKVIKDAGLKLD